MKYFPIGPPDLFVLPLYAPVAKMLAYSSKWKSHMPSGKTISVIMQTWSPVLTGRSALKPQQGTVNNLLNPSSRILKSLKKVRWRFIYSICHILHFLWRIIVYSFTVFYYILIVGRPKQLQQNDNKINNNANDIQMPWINAYKQFEPKLYFGVIIVSKTLLTHKISMYK